MQEAKRATRPIYCYKILVQFHDELTDGFEFLSPVQYHTYKPGVIMKLDESERFRTSNDEFKRGDWASISYGFHSFASLESIGLSSSECRRKSFVVAKCRIPRGSWYWKGNRGGWGREEYDEYCSDHIELVAWLDPESGEWRRPKCRVLEWPESSDISLLNGMTLDEAQDRLSERYEMHCCHGNRSTGRFWFGAKGKNIPYAGDVVWLMVNRGIVTGQW